MSLHSYLVAQGLMYGTTQSGGVLMNRGISGLSHLHPFFSEEIETCEVKKLAWGCVTVGCVEA